MSDGSDGRWGSARWRAACLVPSTSTTTYCWSKRSHKPPTEAKGGSRHQICLKERSQRLHGRLIQGCQKSRKCRARGEELAAKQAHTCFSKGPQSLIKCFEGRFATESIPDQHDDEIHGIVVTTTRSGKRHVLLDGFQKASVLEHLSHHSHFSQPARG